MDDKKLYHFTFCFTNNSAFTAIIDPTSVTINGVNEPVIFPAGAFDVQPGQKVCKYVDAGPFATSEQGAGTLFYTYTINGVAVAAFYQTGQKAFHPCEDPIKHDPPHCGSLGDGTPC